jgi:hypothetical protein
MINLLDMNDIQRVIGEINSNENLERKKREYKAELIYDGLQYNYVVEKLKAMYPVTYQLYTVSNYNILKKIVKKLSKAYKEQPRRRLTTDVQTETYETYLDIGNFATATRECEIIYNKHRYGLLGVYFDVDQNGLQVPTFMALPPYQYDVVKDDFGNLECVIMSYQPSEIQQLEDGDLKDQLIASVAHEEGVDQRVYSFWTESQHVIIKAIKRSGDSDTRLEFVPIPENPNNVNPYGVMNFVEFPRIGSNYPRRNTLADNSVELNTLLSVYYTSANMQIGQLIMKYPADKKITTMAHGLMNVINLPQSTDPNDPPTDANYISPSPNLSGHKEAIVVMMNAILDEYGINTNGVVNSSQNFTSGLDRLLSSSDVQDYIEETQQVFHEVEQAVFKMLNAVNKNSLGDSLQVTYSKPKVLITDTEKLNNIKLAYELGVIEEHEKLIIYDPNLTDDEAKTKLERIKSQRADNVQRVIGAINEDEDDSEISTES